MFEDLEEKRHAVLEGVYFPLNAAQYLPESEAALNALAQFLVRPPEMEIEIHGHTDSRGPAENNKKFSRLRADAIKKALEQRGVDGTRIRAEGFGPRDPIADNEDPAGREKNRRIEIFLFPKEGASAGGEAKNL
jgi:chemotaxis protein MotB